MPRFVVPFLLVFMWLVSVQSVSADQYIDPDLAAAIVVMRSTATGEEVYQQYLEAGVVSIAFVEFEHDTGGARTGSLYWPDDNVVQIGEHLRSETVFVHAAWILHEVVHAWQAHKGELDDPLTREYCIQRETEAYTVQAKWWRELFGADGKSNPVGFESSENTRIEWYLVDAMDEMMAGWESYQNYCSQFSFRCRR